MLADVQDALVAAAEQRQLFEAVDGRRLLAPAEDGQLVALDDDDLADRDPRLEQLRLERFGFSRRRSSGGGNALTNGSTLAAGILVSLTCSLGPKPDVHASGMNSCNARGNVQSSTDAAVGAIFSQKRKCSAQLEAKMRRPRHHSAENSFSPTSIDRWSSWNSHEMIRRPVFGPFIWRISKQKLRHA